MNRPRGWIQDSGSIENLIRVVEIFDRNSRSIFATLNLRKELPCYGYVSHNAYSPKVLNNRFECSAILKKTCNALYVKVYAKSRQTQKNECA